MKNVIKDILISQLSFPLKYKNEKEIWWSGMWGQPITIEIIDAENEQYVARRYLESGQLQYKEKYYQGRLHGEYLEWYDNGQLSVKENYYQRKRHGECLQWYRSGKLRYKAKYNYGKLINEKCY